MLGWNMRVYRLGDSTPLAGVLDVAALLANSSTETERADLAEVLVTGEELAIWQAGIDGLD
jgi:hypothetical protein